MPRARVIYEEEEYLAGYYPRAKEWVGYTGKLTISERKTAPVKLQLRMEYLTIDLTMGMPEKKTITGKSVTEVYGKLSRWYLSYGILFKN
ncbi:MAG TPA: hypothetical protein ENO01_01430 [Candidatus Marinimicrobia bacterium]|nr:hypothetical protein [Candidatus Neomarinimicrobiota bacterium]